MEAEGNGADPSDYNTRLPPRKRLLAELKKQSCGCASSPPRPWSSSDVGAHFCDLFNFSNLSPEEIIEASSSAALAAAEAAAAAKATAVEKTAVAAKAKAFARSVLGLVVSITRNENCRESGLARNKSKKKHVPVELLYKTNCPVVSSETDEELARRLHRAMNSSPRNLRKLVKVGNLTRMRDFNGDTICDGNLTSFYDGDAESSNGNSVDEVEKGVMCSKVECLEKEAETSDHSERYQLKFKSKNVVGGKRGRNKQKKLPLSQCCMKDREDTREIPASKRRSLTGEPKLDGSTKDMPLSAPKPSNEGAMSLEATSMWKSKKLKMSKCFSESKTLRSLCSIPAVTSPSALVKVD